MLTKSWAIKSLPFLDVFAFPGFARVNNKEPGRRFLKATRDRAPRHKSGVVGGRGVFWVSPEATGRQEGIRRE